MGASSYANSTYDPAVANSGNAGSYTGTYKLRLERIDGSTSSLSGLNAPAISGTAARSSVAAANVGQTLTVTGSGLVSTDRVVFLTQDSAGNLNSVSVTPTSVAADGTSLAVVIPNNAASGTVRIARENAGQFLQIVPTLVDVDQGLNDVFRGGGLRLRGTGFIEGAVTVNFGSVAVVDTSAANGPNVFAGYVFENDAMDLTVPSNAPYGPVTVTTLGGTSAPYGLTLSGIVAVAGSGTPANAAVASANPGQAITLQGSGFDTTTDVVFETLDSAGNRSERVVRPVAVNAAATELTVVVPLDVAVTGVVGIVGDRNNAALALQIVPVLDSVDFTSIAGDGSSAQVVLRGAGFTEGVGTYRFGNVDVIDNSVGQGPDVRGQFIRDNDSVFLTLPTTGDYHGAVTVTNAGGTSAPRSSGFTGITTTALSGTPADAAKASANPGQSITLNGTGLTTTSDIISIVAKTGRFTQISASHCILLYL